MTSIIGLIMAVTASLLTLGARADDLVFQDQVQGQTPAMANPHFDILIVTVISMDSGPFTNQKPPRGLARVDEVLRGDERSGATFPILWGGNSPPQYEEPGGLRDGTYIAPRGVKRDWAERPLAAPDIGDRFIVFDAGVVQKGRISAQEAYRFTAENRDLVTKNMAPPERRGIVQGLAFFLILVAPAACIWLHIRSRSSKLTDDQKGRARIALALTVPAAMADYAFYESGISIHSNIRVDLLVIWPALALTVAIACLSLVLFALRSPPIRTE
jgi:hypothetical protein